MKKVWKCDFCYYTEMSIDKMLIHENSCSLNPKFKKCYSCNNYYTFWDSEKCRKELDVFDGQDDGNCIGWETNNKKILRKVKLDQLNKLK